MARLSDRSIGRLMLALAAVAVVCLLAAGHAQAQSLGASGRTAGRVAERAPDADLGTAAGNDRASFHLGDAVRQDARQFGGPMVIAILVTAFLAFQCRADKFERKLADAPLDQGERLRFR